VGSADGVGVGSADAVGAGDATLTVGCDGWLSPEWLQAEASKTARQALRITRA
jgi:hypothetical protein